MNFNGVQIGTEDVQRLAEFYTKIMGEPKWQMDDFYGWESSGVNIMMGPHSSVNGTSAGPERMMMLFECDDVLGEFDRLVSLGAKEVAAPYPPDGDKDSKFWLATVADVDGNYLQLASPWEG